jgi:tellurite resistance protein
VKPTAHVKSLVEAFCARFGADDEGITTAVDLAVLVAAADGTIDPDERAALNASLEAIMGASVSHQVVRYLVRESRNQTAAVGPDARARAIGGVLAAHRAVDEGLRLALAIAFASEGLSAPEREVIALVARTAGASETRLEALIAAAAAPLVEAEPEAEAEGA